MQQRHYYIDLVVSCIESMFLALRRRRLYDVYLHREATVSTRGDLEDNIRTDVYVPSAPRLERKTNSRQSY